MSVGATLARIAVLGDMAILPVVGSAEASAAIAAGLVRAERRVAADQLEDGWWGRLVLTEAGRGHLASYVTAVHHDAVLVASIRHRRSLGQ